MATKAVIASVVALVTSILMLVPHVARAGEYIVGDDQHWRFGYNYSAWAHENSPFTYGDVLVFMYNPPNGTNAPHTVVRFNNSDDYEACNIKKSTLLANVTQGAGEGFKIRLVDLTPYYFADGIRDGFNCRNGTMKFIAYTLD